jgi:hypothetical protein
MTIATALQKLDSLTESELKHCIQRMDVEIDYYNKCIKNYDPVKLEKYGFPYLKRLDDQRQKFIDQLNKL